MPGATEHAAMRHHGGALPPRLAGDQRHHEARGTGRMHAESRKHQHVAQPRLRLITDHDGLDQVASRAARLLDAGDRRRNVFARVADVLGEIHIEKIEKAHLRAVDEGGTRRRDAASTPDQRRAAFAGTKRRRYPFGDARGLAVDRAERTAERIEHQPLHRRDGAGRQLVETDIRGKLSEPLRLGDRLACGALGRGLRHGTQRSRGAAKRTGRNAPQQRAARQRRDA